MASGSDNAPERLCSFEPSVWDDFFVHYNPKPQKISEECMRVKADKLKDDIDILFQTCSTVVEKMILVDALQRLGIDHLFQDQIDTALKEIHDIEFNCCSLYEVALRFRLLREHGLWVSPDVFNNFKTGDGGFNKEIINEPMSLLSLYNAAYLSVHGEPELDEAISFARHHLEAMRISLKYPLSDQVKRNLEIPLPRTLRRLDAPTYITEYEQEQGYNSSVLELAKLDFNLLQRLHQRELKAFSRWGNDLYEEAGLTYARNRIVECYFWAYTELYEQQYGDARIILAKIFVLTSLLDDTFDMHASLDEGRMLNEAIQIWDDSAIITLPEYLKKYYVRLINTFREIEDELEQHHKYRVVYSRKMLQTVCRHFQQEAEWFHSCCIPSFGDHLKISVISAGTPMLFVSSLVGMGDEATKEAFEWASGCTDAVKACAEITRFMDDLATLKHGKNKMDVASSLDSYMNEYHVTSQVAVDVLENMVEDAWKTTNQARFDRRALLPLVNRVASISKSMAFLFRDMGDRYTFSRGNKDKIWQQFVDPIPL